MLLFCPAFRLGVLSLNCPQQQPVLFEIKGPDFSRVYCAAALSSIFYLLSTDPLLDKQVNLPINSPSSQVHNITEVEENNAKARKRTIDDLDVAFLGEDDEDAGSDIHSSN